MDAPHDWQAWRSLIEQQTGDRYTTPSLTAPEAIRIAQGVYVALAETEALSPGDLLIVADALFRQALDVCINEVTHPVAKAENRDAVIRRIKQLLADVEKIRLPSQG